MERRLQDYKKNRVAGMNPYNAARAAGFSKSQASKANSIESRIKDDIKNAFEQAGLTDQKIVTVALEGLNATESGKPLWNIRHKYLNTILELTERLQTQAIDNSKNFNSVFLSEKLKGARMRTDVLPTQ